MPFDKAGGDVMSSNVVGRMPSGHFVAEVPIESGVLRVVGKTLFHLTRSVLIVSPDLKVIARIGPLPSDGDRFGMKVNGLSITDAVPYSSSSTVRVFGDRLYLAKGPSFEIFRYDATGALREVFRRAVTPRPIGESAKASFRKWYRGEIERRARSVEAKGNKESGRLTRQLRPVWLNNVPFPAAAPLIANFVVDAQGYIWVDDYVMLSDSLATWSILDPQGRYLGSLPRPRDIETLFVSDTLVVGLAKDDDEVETVRVNRVRGRDVSRGRDVTPRPPAAPPARTRISAPTAARP